MVREANGIPRGLSHLRESLIRESLIESFVKPFSVTKRKVDEHRGGASAQAGLARVPIAGGRRGRKTVDPHLAICLLRGKG